MPNPDRAWMLTLIDVLFEEYTAVAAMRLLRDDLAREATVPLLKHALAERHAPSTGLDDPGGDNLLQGLLALRVKFTWAEAREKVVVNIAMHGRER